MRITETTFGIELTKSEIELITNALNYECEYEKEKIAELKQSHDACDHAEWPKIEKTLQEYKRLREEMGKLIGVTFYDCCKYERGY